MKPLMKIILAVLFFTGAYNFLNAQVGLGIRGGVNFAKAELEEKSEGNWVTTETDFIPRLNIGLLVEIPVSGKFAVQPEVNLIQKGYKTSVDNGATYELKNFMNYLEVPVLFKGKFGGEKLRFNVLAGPTFGYALDGKIKIEDEETDIDFDESELKRTEIGALLGVGMSYTAGPGAIFLDARLGWGITNLDDSSNSDNFHWHHRGVSVGAGYIYLFGK